jgi:hypothetical protein
MGRWFNAIHLTSDSKRLKWPVTEAYSRTKIEQAPTLIMARSWTQDRQNKSGRRTFR